MSRLAIIGTGMVGASLGLAIKQAKVRDLEIVGSDLERRHANKAKDMGAVDRVSGSLVGAVNGAQVVVIATPVMAIKEVMKIIGSSLEPGCLVTDTGSSKGISWSEFSARAATQGITSTRRQVSTTLKRLPNREGWFSFRGW